MWLYHSFSIYISKWRRRSHRNIQVYLAATCSSVGRCVHGGSHSLAVFWQWPAAPSSLNVHERRRFSANGCLETERSFSAVTVANLANLANLTLATRLHWQNSNLTSQNPGAASICEFVCVIVWRANHLKHQRHCYCDTFVSTGATPVRVVRGTVTVTGWSG